MSVQEKYSGNENEYYSYLTDQQVSFTQKIDRVHPLVRGVLTEYLYLYWLGTVRSMRQPDKCE